MGAAGFDIYQTDEGYVAVTNDVRRLILHTLAKKERQLPELVRITKKAKPTLSSVHMRDLLEKGLVEEVPHPKDGRRKIFRLLARRVGTSHLTVEDLRAAVQHYSTLGPAAWRLPLAAALDSIGAAPPETSLLALEAQAKRLGALASPLIHELASAKELVTPSAQFLEREGIARPLQIDLEHERLTVALPPTFAPESNPARRALLVGSLLDGALSARLAHPVVASPDGDRRLRLSLPVLA